MADRPSLHRGSTSLPSSGWYPGFDLVSTEQLAVITVGELISVDRGLNIELVGRLPAQPTVEAQPVAIRLAGEQVAVAIDACHAQLVIVLRPDGGRVQPGQGSAGSAAG